MGRAGIVLCGGRSSRMGRPKAWLPWFGRTMVEHVVETLRPVVDEVLVVTSAELDLPPLEARVVRDSEPERGPLAGLRDGFSETAAELVFVTSTDAPFLTSDFVAAALARGRSWAPVDGRFVQVLCGVYSGAAGAKAAKLLDADKRRPLDLLEAIGYEAVDAAVAHPTDGPAPWSGFNTPTDYLEAVRRVDSEASCEIELLGRAALHGEPKRRRLPVGTVGELLARWPEDLGLIEEGRVSKHHLVSLGGRDLARDPQIPVGPGERVSVIDALAGG